MKRCLVFLMSIIIVSGVNPISAFGCKNNERVILKHNRSFASQVNKKYRVYVIKDEFDLGNRIVSLPKGSTLVFEGGSLKGNGTIVGNKTTIHSSEPNIIQGLTIEGTWLNRRVNVSWFSDNSQRAIENSIAVGDSVIIDKNICFTDNLETSKSFLTIISNHNKITEGVYSWTFQNVQNIKCEGIDFYGTKDYVQHSTATSLEFNIGKNIVVSDCSLDGCFFYGFWFVSSSSCASEDA